MCSNVDSFSASSDHHDEMKCHVLDQYSTACISYHAVGREIVIVCFGGLPDGNREQYVRTRTVTPMVSNLRPHPALGDSGDSGYLPSFHFFLPSVCSTYYIV